MQICDNEKECSEYVHSNGFKYGYREGVRKNTGTRRNIYRCIKHVDCTRKLYFDPIDGGKFQVVEYGDHSAKEDLTWLQEHLLKRLIGTNIKLDILHDNPALPKKSKNQLKNLRYNAKRPKKVRKATEGTSETTTATVGANATSETYAAAEPASLEV